MKKKDGVENVAFTKYRECAKTNIELALVYLMNAITHDPRIDYLEEYVKILCGMRGARLDSVLPQAYNILSMAALNGPADQVPVVQRLIIQLQDLEFSRETKGSQSNRRSDGDLKKEAERELKRYEWGTLVEKGLMFDAKLMQEKSDALKQLLSAGMLSEEESEQYIDDLDKTQWQLNLITILGAITEGVSHVNEELSRKKANPYRVSALMSQIASTLSQLWVLHPDGPISGNELDVICKDKQELFRTCEEPAQKVLSQKPYDQAVKCNAELQAKIDAAGDGDHTETQKIEYCQNAIRTLQELLGGVTYKEYRSQVLELIKNVGDMLTKFTRQRYAKYQKKMSSFALDAIKQFDDITIVTEKDAEKILKKCHIAEVDESLLCPEAASMFQSAKSMLVDKLGRVNRAEFDMECVTARKFSLEQY